MIDLFAYVKLYRRLIGGEWVYVYDYEFEVYHWTNPTWLSVNRYRSQYKVVTYENY